LIPAPGSNTKGINMVTLTHKVCEQMSMHGLPISRTSGRTAKHTRKWKAERSWWNPELETKVRRTKQHPTLVGIEE